MLPPLVLGDEKGVRPHLEQLLAINPKKIGWPEVRDASRALADMDGAVLRTALEGVLERHHRAARDRRSQIHGLAMSFFCEFAVTYAALGIWCGLLKRSEVPQRQEVLMWETLLEEFEKPTLFYQLHVDYLPHELLPADA